MMHMNAIEHHTCRFTAFSVFSKCVFGVAGFLVSVGMTHKASALDAEIAHAVKDTPFASVSDNLRLAADLSTRIVFRSEAQKTYYQNAIGLDAYKVFSNAEGDWGTLIAQTYLTRIDDRNMRPCFFSDEDDWKLVFRIFNFNYTGFGLGKPNIRIGHFEIPFGLEHVINTNGTLRQYNQAGNLGMKADWGMSVNGAFRKVDYEFSVSQASGQDVTWRGLNDRYALAGRIGKNDWLQWIDIGLSGYYAELEGNGGRRWRVAADGRWYYRQWGIFGELSSGENNQRSLVNGIFEINRRSNDDTWLFYSQLFLQTRELNTQWDDSIHSTFGIRYTPDNHWSFSTRLRQSITAYNNNQRSTELALQARYRF